MEYLVSNVEISNTTQIAPHLWIKGTFKHMEDSLYLLEGYVIDYHIKNVEEYLKLGLASHYANGAYNIFYFDKKKGLLEIKTDKRSAWPMYLYEKGDVFALSNNPWRLVKYFHDDVSIAEGSLKSQLLYFDDYHPTHTLFANISRVDGATYVRFAAIHNEKKTCRYWGFTYSPDGDVNMKSLLEKVNADFTYYFETVKDQNEGKLAGFGCSGGLDSRIIAHYIHKVGIDCQAFVFGDKYPHHLWRSTTAKTSEMIGDIYGFKVDFIPYQAESIMQSMVLDIRNNPFIYSQAYINPYDGMPPVDYMFAGDPGGVAYMAAYVLTGDPLKLKEHANYFIGYRQWPLTGLPSLLRKAALHLRIPFDPYRDDGALGLERSSIPRVISPKIRKECQDELNACIDSIGGENNVEKWMRIHDKVTVKYQYSSGYGSINQTKRSYQLYYPFFYDTIDSIPPEYFRDKYFLKIIEFINPELLNIPDQNLNLIKGIHSGIGKIRNRIKLALRGRGLNFLHLLKTSEHKKFAHGIFNRDNPIFIPWWTRNSCIKAGCLEVMPGFSI